MNTPAPQEAFHQWLRAAMQNALGSLRSGRPVDPLYTPINPTTLANEANMRRRVLMHQIFR